MQAGSGRSNGPFGDRERLAGEGQAPQPRPCGRRPAFWPGLSLAQVSAPQQELVLNHALRGTDEGSVVEARKALQPLEKRARVACPAAPSRPSRRHRRSARRTRPRPVACPRWPPQIVPAQFLDPRVTMDYADSVTAEFHVHAQIVAPSRRRPHSTGHGNARVQARL
jgi:hypothetical protein